MLNSLVSTNISLKEKNWFKTGGLASFYCQPRTAQEFKQALSFAQEKELSAFILGKGANILISDEGFNGLIIQPELRKIKIVEEEKDYCLVEAETGAEFSELINYTLDNNLLGLEEFAGIPGSVGGSVYINIHYFQFLLSQFLVHAQVIEKKTGNIDHVDNSWFQFGYNQSKLIAEEHYLVSATFRLKKATDYQTAYARGRHNEIIRHRKARYPNSNTCGSFFRNFHDHEVELTSNGKKMIYVAYYLDKLGVKGQLSVGDAIVSYQHANMLVNRGQATTSNIIELARTMQLLVRENFGIIPQPECRFVGFKEYPLLT